MASFDPLLGKLVAHPHGLTDIPVGTSASQVLTTGSSPFAAEWSSWYLTGTSAQTYTLPASGGTLALASSVPTGANPTASVGLTAVNGAAATFLRSDGAPALDVSIAPTWTGAHTFTNATPITISSAAPKLVFTDTTASAKGLTIAVDSNVTYFYESAGSSTSLFMLDLANNTVGIGTAPASDTLVKISKGVTSTSNFYGLSAAINVSPSAHTAQTYYGINFSSIPSGNKNIGSVIALYNLIQSTATSSISGLVGTYSDIQNWAATLSNQYAHRAKLGFIGGATTNAYLFYGELAKTSGTVTNLYGIYLPAVTQGGTLNYAFYSDGLGLNRFGDQLAIVGGADRAQLTVTGHTTQAQSTGLAGLTRNDTAAGISSILGLTGLGSGAANDGISVDWFQKSSTTAAQQTARIRVLWSTATHASRQAKMVLSAYDTAERDNITIGANGSAATIGFLGATAVAQRSSYVSTGLSDLGLWSSVTSAYDDLVSYNDETVYYEDNAVIL